MAADGAGVDAPRVIFHLGAAKTGTTTLQYWLRNNRGRLPAQGFDYPQLVPEPPQGAYRPAFLTAQHILGMRWGRGWLRPAEDDMRRAWERLAELARRGERNVIVSSEVFFGQLAHEPAPLLDAIAEALPPGRARFIVYLRHQADFLRSSLFHELREGARHRSVESYVSSPPEYLRPQLDYAATLAPLADRFGEEAVAVRPLEPASLVGGDLCVDFAAAAELPDPGALTPPERENTYRDTPAILAFSLAMNRAEAPRRAALLREAYETAERVAPDMPAYAFPAEIVERVAARWGEGNAEVARRFLGREDGALFRSPVAARPADPGAEAAALAIANELLARRGRTTAAGDLDEAAARLAEDAEHADFAAPPVARAAPGAADGPPELAIVSIPRSGTNHFCDTLGAFPRACNLFEIYNPRGVFGAQPHPELFGPLSERLGREVTQATDPDLIAFARAEPLAALDLLREGARAKDAALLSYKVFPNQIPDAALAELLGDPRRRFALIVRRRLDCYVSFQKALSIDHWENRSTKDIEISVDADDFLDWCAAQDRWFESAEARIRAAGGRYRIFSYEADIDGPKRKLAQRLLFGLRSLGLDPEPPAEIPAPGFKRQDKRAGPFAKIANGAELRAELKRRGRLRHALAQPLSGV